MLAGQSLFSLAGEGIEGRHGQSSAPTISRATSRRQDRVSDTILVTGASRRVGGEVVRQLAGAGRASGRRWTM